MIASRQRYDQGHRDNDQVAKGDLSRDFFVEGRGIRADLHVTLHPAEGYVRIRTYPFEKTLKVVCDLFLYLNAIFAIYNDVFFSPILVSRYFRFTTTLIFFPQTKEIKSS